MIGQIENVLLLFLLLHSVRFLKFDPSGELINTKCYSANFILYFWIGGPYNDFNLTNYRSNPIGRMENFEGVIFDRVVHFSSEAIKHRIVFLTVNNISRCKYVINISTYKYL